MLSCPLAQVVAAAVGIEGDEEDGVCWWDPRPRGKTKRCASPTWTPLPEEFESMGVPRSSLKFPSMRPVQLIIFFFRWWLERQDSYHYVWGIYTGSRV